jgi:hypothetical protein
MFLELLVGHLLTKLEPRLVETTWTGCGAWRIGMWSDEVSWFEEETGPSSLLNRLQ